MPCQSKGHGLDANCVRVRVAEGGGVSWRDTTHSEALLFLTPSLQVRRGVSNHRSRLSCERARVKTHGAQGVFPAVREEERHSDARRRRSRKAALLRRVTACIPWPVSTPPTPASSSRCRTFSFSAAKELHEECKARIVDLGQRHIARYGGRLLGGSRRTMQSVGLVKMAAPEQLVLSATSFEGILDGSNYLPTFYLLKDVFHYDPVNISLTFGFIMMPWLLKPALALLSDRVTILGRRRTPYITVSALIIAGGFMGAGTLVTANSVVGSLCCLTVGRTLLGSAVQGILVEVGRDRDHDETTKLVADFFLLRALTAVCASIVTTVSVSRLGPRRTFRLFALLPALIFAAVIQYEVLQSYTEIEEAEEETHEDLEEFSWHGLREMMTMPAVWGPLVFLFVYNAGPNYDDPLYFYFINKLQFEPYMVGQLQIAHALAKVMGILLYRFVLLDVEDRTLIVAMTALSCPLMMSPLLLTTGAYKHLLINPRVLALSGELVRELFIQIQMMPPMARWVQLTPKGYEGTMVSLLISTIHLSRASSKLTSASVATLTGVTSTNFQNISVLITVCGSSTLIPILFARELIPDPGRSSGGDDAGSLQISDLSETSTGAGTGLHVADISSATSTDVDTSNCERRRGNLDEDCSNMMPAG